MKGERVQIAKMVLKRLVAKKLMELLLFEVVVKNVTYIHTYIHRHRLFFYLFRIRLSSTVYPNILLEISKQWTF